MKAFSINKKVSLYLIQMTYYRAVFVKSLDCKGEQHSPREDAKFAAVKGAIQSTFVVTNAMRLRIIYKKKVS